MRDSRSATGVDGELGARLRARRLEIGMSQETLAEKLGITFQQVQKYEKGVNRIAASRLFDIARVLGLPVGNFFDGVGPKMPERSKPSRALAPGASAEWTELAALFGAIRSKPVRRKVLELVRTLSEAG